ncbi:hypothetical protein N7450_011783 [Penicillium hetheringtonii]|uniref:DUF3752 domain-containing protein n=1 Tax=Penicillium hetheringtonii TaxID=911720 RepID=A0AAD6DCA1_9EURO|nr:hypothetical protein N7450_011783 [Penicillium hetheringtonii]
MEEKRKAPHDEEDAGPLQKKRVLGPTLPPPAEDNSADGSGGSDSDDSDDSDDDFGPSMPPPAGQSIAPAVQQTAATSHTPSEDKKQKPKSSRDQWMLHPPEQSDWASKIDPTQLRNRKFQTGKSARSGDKMMGVGAAPSSGTSHKAEKKDTGKDREMEEKIKKYNERSGKNTRLEKAEKQKKEEEDDPSRRAFDREKDMAVSSKISNAQRRDMVNKASDYGSRFSKGSFL